MAREFGLGRLEPPPDGRDQQFRMAAAMPQLRAVRKPAPRKVRYREGALLNQRATPHCVSFSGKGHMLAAPIMQDPGYETTAIYRECQRADEWPGENYDGTSVRALMKVLQARGWIASYVWGQTTEELVEWILGGYGTAIGGTAWYASMDEVDSKGFVPLPGSLATPIGGHAYRYVWFDRKLDAFLLRNSWGEFWGQAKRGGTHTGEAWLRRVDAERLQREGGEMGAPTQVRITPTVR